jgi:hypothetical protein
LIFTIKSKHKKGNSYENNQENFIGCYGGDGVEAEYEAETPSASLLRMFKNIIQTIIHEFLDLLGF